MQVSELTPLGKVIDAEANIGPPVRYEDNSPRPQVVDLDNVLSAPCQAWIGSSAAFSHLQLLTQSLPSSVNSPSHLQAFC